MVYGVLKLINFAHGDLFTIGAYLGLTLLVSMGLFDKIGPLPAVILLAIMVMILVAIIGAILERVAYPSASPVAPAFSRGFSPRCVHLLSKCDHGHLTAPNSWSTRTTSCPRRQ